MPRTLLLASTMTKLERFVACAVFVSAILGMVLAATGPALAFDNCHWALDCDPVTHVCELTDTWCVPFVSWFCDAECDREITDCMDDCAGQQGSGCFSACIPVLINCIPACIPGY